MPFSRRHFLTAAAVGLTTPALAQFGAAPAFPQAFSSFAVDVEMLRAKGHGPYADIVGVAALEELQRSFADRTDPRGPRFVLRVTSLVLTSNPDRGGGDRWRGGGGSGTDALEGEALAVGPRGVVLARHPQLAVLDVSRSIVDPDEPGRTAAVARHYVRWLRRRL
ncbi:hypothetical protein [Microvirga aerophila]|uniref:Uncharacterized protein n=1 Tax=Microvirga aerophila TaxID=670291 RepID=A0A512BTF7_9HYPH|nr:hypothetical protein [Microvirga aerophila]GEO15276.1 hypothetical protein MAE02_29720 [Microvirga aerophila]